MTATRITGLFDSRAAAERAVEHLVQHHGIARQAVRVQALGAGNVAAGTHEPRSEEHHGFVPRAPGGAEAAGKGLPRNLPEAARDALAEAAQRAGILVTAEVPAARREEAMRAFRENGAVEVALAEPGRPR